MTKRIRTIASSIGFMMLTLFACLLFSAPTKAGVFVCNQTGLDLYLAIGWQEGDKWSSRGWWQIKPRECAHPLHGAIENRVFYYYAENAGRSLKWRGGLESAHFCTTNEKFYYSFVADPPCKGENFRKVDAGVDEQYTLHLTESQMEPAQAAQECASRISEGRDAFTKCWIRNASTTTQRKILDCWDEAATPASFAICASRGNISPEVASAADCVSKYNANSSGTALVSCLSKDRLSEQEQRILNCALSSQGSFVNAGSCALGAQLSPEQRRLLDCVATNRTSYRDMAFCAAAPYVTSEQRRIANCVLNNRTSYVGMGVCAAGSALTPEQQVFVQCAVSTGGQPYAFAGCVGTQLTLNELQKCLTDGIGGSGCFGKNNEATKFVRNAWKDVTRGPGPSNDLLGQDGAAIRTVRNVLTGPVNDVLRGEIGGSSESAWRKAGLPRIKLPRIKL
jgi:uncharacterized membrane protein